MTTAQFDRYVEKGIAIFLVLFILGMLWKFFGTSPLYELSSGTMKAKSTKLSYKGWFFKTYDGWIPIGITGDGGISKWRFTVQNNDKKVVECIENNSFVKLYYKDCVFLPYRLGYDHQVYKCEPIKKPKG